jgi:hypothetical protein
MLLSAVSVLVVAQQSSEITEGLMNYPVLRETEMLKCIKSKFGCPVEGTQIEGNNITKYTKTMHRNSCKFYVYLYIYKTSFKAGRK